MKGLFWAGLVVSALLWFAANWLGVLFLTDDLARFAFTFAVAVTGGALVMLALRVRAVRTGRYEKARWGVKRR